MLLLARHGETDDNVPPLRFQGSRDTPLNDTGRAQAAELALGLRPKPIEAIWTSPLSRAVETASVVGRELGIEPVVDGRFAEGSRGRWEGRRMDEVALEEPDLYADWRRPDEGFAFPGGESLLQHQERVAEALDEVRSTGLNSLVVCHGGTIRVELCRGDPRGLRCFHEWDLPNCAVVGL